MLENDAMFIKSCCLNPFRQKEVKGRLDGLTLIELLRKKVEAARALCSVKTSINRTTAINTLERFFIEELQGGQDITLHNLSNSHIKSFERWHREKGYSRNYSACNMRNLRAVINMSSNRNICKELFVNIRTSNTETRKRAVEREVMLKLNSMKLQPNSTEELVRDITIFQFRAMGMPLIDLAFARKTQLKDGHLTYRRHKTNCQTSVLITDAMAEILNRLSPKDTQYLFPIITTEEPREAAQQYKRFLQKTNRTLEKISAKSGHNVRITSYTPRHTWASLAHEAGENINYISQALAHTNIQTTRSYINNISSDIIDGLSRRVQDFLNATNCG